MATPGKDMKVLGSPQLHHETIGDWPVEVMLRQVEDDGRGKLQAFFAIDLPARNELIVFEGSARDEETFNRSLAALNNDVAPILNRFPFYHEGSAPVLGRPTPGAPAGPGLG